MLYWPRKYRCGRTFGRKFYRNSRKVAGEIPACIVRDLPLTRYPEHEKESIIFLEFQLWSDESLRPRTLLAHIRTFAW
jgi:hypothetical protein